MTKTSCTIFLGVIFGLLLSLYFAFVVFVKKFTNTDSIIFIPKGSGVYYVIKSFKSETTSVLEELILKTFSKFYCKNKILNYGEYKIVKGQTYFQILQQIIDGRRFYRKITLIDGEYTENFLATINSASDLTGYITEETSEGELMPDTYYYLYGDTKNSIIIRAKKVMKEFVETQISQFGYTNNNYLQSPREVLIMASIIQAEAANDQEKPLISSVFKNRLASSMRLQSDPTIIYQITKGKYKLERKLNFNDLAQKGDYNTYQINGLPLSPINNPSRSSIIAALNPEETNYLYFVLKPSLGRHVFSNEYRVHLQNAQEYRKKTAL